MKIDFNTEVWNKTGTDSYIPVGTSVVTITKALPKDSHAGNAGLKVEFKDATGRVDSDYFSFAEKAQWKLITLYKSVGFGPGIDTAELVGRKVKFTKELKGVRTEGDKTYNDYNKNYAPVDGASVSATVTSGPGDDEIPF